MYIAILILAEEGLHAKLLFYKEYFVLLYVPRNEYSKHNKELTLSQNSYNK